MGSNADGNTVVKWKKDEQCSLVTLLTACWSCIDSKLCSLGLKEGQNLFYLRLVVLINTLCSESTFTRDNLLGWGGGGDWGHMLRGRGWDRDRGCGDGVGMGFVFTGTGGDGVQFLSPCIPLVWSERQEVIDGESKGVDCIHCIR